MRAARLHVALLAAVTVAVCANTLANGFVWDDHQILVGNPVYEQFDLRAMFFGLGNRLEYQPLRDLSFAVDFALFGWRAWAIHLVNALLYLGVVLAVYAVCRRVARLLRPEADATKGDRAALVTALLFAVHPIHSEVTSFAVCRNVLLSGLFFFLACWAYLRHLQDSRGRVVLYGASLAFFFAALLSKATSVAFPAVLAVLQAASRERASLRRWAGLIPFAVLGVAFAVLAAEIGRRVGVVNEIIRLGEASLSSRAAAALQIPAFYLFKLTVPVGLSAEYDVAFPRSLASPAALGGALLLIALAAAAAYVRRRLPAQAVAVGWFLATLFPVLGLLSTASLVADRYVFLGSFGFCLAVAEVLAMLGTRWRAAALGLTTLVVAGWSALAVARNAAWKDDLTLFTRTIEASPGSVGPWVHLGFLSLKAGDAERALEHFGRAEALAPGIGYVGYARANLALKRGDPAAALEHSKAATSGRPHFMDALYLSGVAAEQLGRLEEAMDFYDRVLRSGEVDGSGIKGKARGRREKLRVAFEPKLASFRDQLAADPGALGPRVELALLLHRIGDRPAALAEYRELERRGAHSWQLFYDVAEAARAEGDSRLAAEYYAKCLQLEQASGACWRGLASAEWSRRRRQEAIAALQRALEVDPKDGEAMLGLGTFHFQLGEGAEARHWLEQAASASPALARQAAPYLRELGRQ
ncbi:MAG: tetratricopeptide repeat protein [Myxococcales bacterium]|nr:tetratricopeptide repeat protein [Myxococcales bacterium]